MDDLITWYRAQLDAIEEVADACPDKAWRKIGQGAGAEHIALHDPAAVLADIAAKRQLLNAHDREHECIELTGSGDRSVVDGEPWQLWEGYYRKHCFVVRCLAAALAHRPGYREEWRP